MYIEKSSLYPSCYSKIFQTEFEINELITCFPPAEDLKVLTEIKLTKQTLYKEETLNVMLNTKPVLKVLIYSAHLCSYF